MYASSLFSSFAFFYLNGDLYSAVSGAECDTLLDCTLTLFHTELLSDGSMAGKYSESWEENDANPYGLLFNGWDRNTAVNGQYLTVFVFEISFYVIVLIVLLTLLLIVIFILLLTLILILLLIPLQQVDLHQCSILKSRYTCG